MTTSTRPALPLPQRQRLWCVLSSRWSDWSAIFLSGLQLRASVGAAMSHRGLVASAQVTTNALGPVPGALDAVRREEEGTSTPKTRFLIQTVPGDSLKTAIRAVQAFGACPLIRAMQGLPHKQAVRIISMMEVIASVLLDHFLAH